MLEEDESWTFSEAADTAMVWYQNSTVRDTGSVATSPSVYGDPSISESNTPFPFILILMYLNSGYQDNW